MTTKQNKLFINNLISFIVLGNFEMLLTKYWAYENSPFLGLHEDLEQEFVSQQNIGDK